MLKERYVLTQSQKMMVFILSMCLYGLSNMFTELVPSVNIGPIELQIDCFAFIPLALCMLFHPLYAAIGASTGELIFGELMLGQFGGIDELEKFILFSLGMCIGGMIIRNAQSRSQVAMGAIAGYGIFLVLSTIVDIVKVVIGVEDFEAVPGLAESIYVVEGVEFLTDLIFSGTLFALLPTLYLVPRLYGKIEPLLGMKPRSNKANYQINEIITPKFVLMSLVLSVIAFLATTLAELDIEIGVWEPEFVDTYGTQVIWIVIGVAALCSIAIIAYLLKKGKDSSKEDMSNIV
ncbi:cell division protein FtsQ [Robertmurraya kyonggiensis]|uniref:Cell division protein FtsQ n=1 Tax=Robertmurraya kyonggiensis TaxID=1037680 RepID=A0A4U1D1P8_9BACI|nr:cell division protein FtsQ [Robertmurraya kyonggiensis]TKC16131.1 cell division protein FtsQ [Robertmurraya kyonggiensis]